MKNSFSINMIFVLLSVIGIALISRLPVQLQPQPKGRMLSISYNWYGAGAEIVEKEVTSLVEGTIASLKGVENIVSESYEGKGVVKATFKKDIDMDMVRFEVSGLMRTLHPKLPNGVDLPRVKFGGQDNHDTPRLLVYSINGEGTSLELKNYTDKYLIPQISYMSEISEAYSYGASNLEWQLHYDKNKISQYGITVNIIRDAINNFLLQEDLGIINWKDNEEAINLSISSYKSDSFSWNECIIGKYNDRIIKLTDIVEPKLEEGLPHSYYRINGLSSIYLVIHSASGANQIELANKVKSIFKQLEPTFPPNFSLIANYDASDDITKEIKKISARAVLALIILIIFVLIISRSWRYLLIIALSLIANLSISVIFYLFFKIEIHLYSLAGITISLGMIIDNTIIMADHLRHKKDKSVFLAILASTLTTIGAMAIIFFLKEEQKLNLIDFSTVVIINLSISLLVSLLLVPSLMQRIKLKSNSSFILKRKRRALKLSNLYERFLNFSIKYKWAYIILFIWAFGIPLFYLPDKIPKNEEATKWYQKLYNNTWGNQTFSDYVKPWMNKVLGGSLYYFSNYYSTSHFNWDASKTTLYAVGSMPDGSTLEQMNDVFLKLENYLSQFEEIEIFTSEIYNTDYASMQITFKPNHENGSFPHILKSRLIRFVTQIGNANFSIYGVGQGFSNATYDSFKNNRFELRGYNYEYLLSLAEVIKDSLMTNPRIQDVVIQTGSSFFGKPQYSFVMALNNEKMAEADASLYDVYNQMLFQSPQKSYVGHIYANLANLPIFFEEEARGQTTVWEMNNNVLKNENKSFRLKDFGSLVRERTGDKIEKENQEYKLGVDFNFIGPWELNNKTKEIFIEKFTKKMPLGFSLKSVSPYMNWSQDENPQYALLIIVFAIIFMLCAILLESLFQPFAIIATIPIAFIGMFLTFIIFKINFDQGGYASIILLAGLTVNSSLYIVNDFNQLRKNKNLSSLKIFIKAFNMKIIPILLTTLSTILGLLPFIIVGKGEGFWFSLAAGSIGGLIFSLIAVFILLPLILIKKGK